VPKGALLFEPRTLVANSSGASGNEDSLPIVPHPTHVPTKRPPTRIRHQCHCRVLAGYVRTVEGGRPCEHSWTRAASVGISLAVARAEGVSTTVGVVFMRHLSRENAASLESLPTRQSEGSGVVAGRFHQKNFNLRSTFATGLRKYQ
jgi:hypothetical protein